MYRKCECFVMLMCMFASCMHPVAVPNAAFCMTFGLLMLVEDARGDHMEEACSRAGLMTVLYVSFGSKVRRRTFGCIAMGGAVFFMLMSKLLLYSAGSGGNRVQVVLSRFSVRLFCFVQENLYVGMVVCIHWLHSCLCV